MTEKEIINLVDPFEGRSFLSFFPRTIRDSKDALKSTDSDDLESIHQYMKSMALRSPNMHFEKAKPIVDGVSEVSNTKESEADSKEKENPQERRPALARKRARFSLKPDTSYSQPSSTLEPSFQIDQLQDPEELFAAYEKLENTRKEMKRQMGGEDVKEVNFPMNARRRRPEISGRRVSYKHHDYSLQSMKDITSSQETLQQDVESPPIHETQQETIKPGKESQEEELAGFVPKTKNRVNKLLDQLLSSDVNKLDGNGTLSLLKDRLRIRPVDTDNLCLPEFHDVGTIDFVSPDKNLLKERNRFPDICTLAGGSRGKTPGKQKELSPSPLLPLALPTPPRNSFSTISTFAKDVLKSISSAPFLAHEYNSSLTTRSLEIMARESDPANKVKEFPISVALASLAKDKDINAAVSEKLSAGASKNLQDMSLNHNMQHVDSSLTESLIGLEDGGQCNNLDERSVDDNVIGLCADTKNQTNEGVAKEGNAEDKEERGASFTETNLNTEDSTDTNAQQHNLRDIEENVEDVLQKAASSTLPEVNAEASTMENLKFHQSHSGANLADDFPASRSSQIPYIGPEKQNERQEHQGTSMNKRKKTTRARKVEQRKMRQSVADDNSAQDCAANRPSQIPNIGPEEKNENPPEASMNKRKKITKTSQADQRKRRQSLAEAGSSWTSGVRRSNRVRHRPLEYWKGERFLYGRVHNSLPTIIGLKYISPAKEDGFKVESYVSDEYKDLVELVALH